MTVLVIDIIFLSLDVVGGQVLLEIEVRQLNVFRRGEESPESLVKNNLATVIGMLQTLIEDVFTDKLSHFRTRNKLAFGKTEESAQLRAHVLLTVEPVILGTLLRLLTIGVLLGTLNLTNKFTKVLHFSAKSEEFSVDGFKGHYIFLLLIIFKSILSRRSKVATVNSKKRYTVPGSRSERKGGFGRRSMYMNGSPVHPP
jgi:hypothetical protein